jgi:glutamine synthetase
MAALCAFGMPNFDSYVCVAHDKAGVWIGFGTENRDLPVRKITDEHREFRFADCTANFYLFMAAVEMGAVKLDRRPCTCVLDPNFTCL